jgi:hypothetical protein
VFLLLDTGTSFCFYFQGNLFQKKRRKRERKTATKEGIEVVRMRIPEEHLCLTEMYHTHISLPKQSEDW